MRINKLLDFKMDSTMKLILSLILLLFSSLTFSGEGHRWVALNYESKAMIIAMYENGIAEGCVNGVSLATSELLADENLQSQHTIKLILKCPNKVVNSQAKMSQIISVTDDAYSKAGAPSIPIGFMVKISIEAVKLGLTKINEKELEKWISIASQM